MKRPPNIDAYVAVLPKETQKLLQSVRGTLKNAIKGGEEVISYGIPAIRANGRIVVYFAGWAKHIAMYPIPRAKSLEGVLAPYVAGKGTLHFPNEKRLPLALIGRVAKARLKENEARAAMLKKPKSAKKTATKSTSTRNTYTHYHNDGTIWAKGFIRGGKMDGLWKWFRKDGSLMRSGNFAAGKQVGEWTTYDKKGSVVKVTQMKAR